jgi:hypothetical protein
MPQLTGHHGTSHCRQFLLGEDSAAYDPDLPYEDARHGQRIPPLGPSVPNMVTTLAAVVKSQVHLPHLPLALFHTSLLVYW